MTETVNNAPPPVPVHPEELKAAWELNLGKLHMAASARCTPAGIVAAGVVVTAILLATRALIRAHRP